MNLHSFAVSAPGKVILHGEHAVVYGQTAVAAAIGLRTTVRVKPCNSNSIILKLLDLSVECSWDAEALGKKLPSAKEDLRIPVPPNVEETAAFLEVVAECDGVQQNKAAKDAVHVFIFLVSRILNSEQLFPITIEVTSSLPIGAGLGSSAAYSVSLVTALLLARQEIKIPAEQWELHGDEGSAIIPDLEDLTLVCKWSFEAEKMIHGKPSGVDNSISTHGGALSFKEGSITHLESIPAMKILLVHSKVPRSTKAMVMAVRQKQQQFPRIYGALFEAMGGISEESCATLQRLASVQKQSVRIGVQEITACYEKLEKLIDLNHDLLSVLGVSHPSLDKICHVTAARGLHSKMTGAGGGGCALTLINEGTSEKAVTQVCEELLLLGFEVWETALGAPGVSVHCR